MAVHPIEELKRIVEDLRVVTQGSCKHLDSRTLETAELVRQYYALRRVREREFGAELFSDPAWDVLLDLYLSESDGKKISVSSACIAAAAPATTALRWIDILCRKGYVIRRADLHDRRRTHLELAPGVASKIDRIFREPGSRHLAERFRPPPETA